MTATEIPDSTSSGLIDTAFVLHYEPLYTVTDLEAEIFDSIRKKVTGRAAYKRKTFLKVAEWKAVAALPTLETIDGDDIDYVTSVALADETPNHLRLPFLMVLPGVGVPLASTLLTVADPKKFAIMDARAVGALHDHGLVESPNPAKLSYLTYRKLMKSLAKGANCTTLDLYRALIAFSRQPRH